MLLAERADGGGAREPLRRRSMLAIPPGFRRHAVLEINAFGDLPAGGRVRGPRRITRAELAALGVTAWEASPPRSLLSLDLDGTLIDRSRGLAVEPRRASWRSHPLASSPEVRAGLLRWTSLTRGGQSLYLDRRLVARVIARSYPELGMSPALRSRPTSPHGCPGASSPPRPSSRMLGEVRPRITRRRSSPTDRVGSSRDKMGRGRV